MAREKVVLIGVDGGATKVRVRHVLRDDAGGEAGYCLGAVSSRANYPNVPAFQPVDLQKQLNEQHEQSIPRRRVEVDQAHTVVMTIASCVIEVARRLGVAKVLLGIGMPGLKTSDRRGIAVCKNGPRIPNLAGGLEDALNQAGVCLVTPIHAIGSDADHCGIGEQYAVGGLLRDVRHAYYLGGGTGIADAMKLDGELVRFDAASAWIAKSWQIPGVLGLPFEELGSARGINERYAECCQDVGGEAMTYPPFPEERAAGGDLLAQQTLTRSAIALAELIFERIDTIHEGRRALPHRGDRYRQLNPNHPYRGTVLERIVIGQQVGRIYADPRHTRCFASTLDASLADHIRSTGGSALKDRCLAGYGLRPGLVVASHLHAAATLGAAIEADVGR